MPVKPKIPKQKAEDVVDEQESGLVEIDFGGSTFVIPRDRDDWSTEGNAYLAEGKYNLFAKYTLEIARSGQWKTLTRLCPTAKDMGPFLMVLGETIKNECVG